jgi:hypothetical protein
VVNFKLVLSQVGRDAQSSSLFPITFLLGI